MLTFHGVFSLQCVGEFNHKYYILFLLAHVVMLLWTLLLLRNAYFDEDDQAAWLLINAPVRVIGMALKACQLTLDIFSTRLALPF